jgi:hypothetical protein
MKHEISSDRTMLGERFITCTCGHVAQGGAYNRIAEQNFAYHQRTARQAELDAQPRDSAEAHAQAEAASDAWYERFDASQPGCWIAPPRPAS